MKYDMTEEQMKDLIGDGEFSLKERIRVAVMTEEGRPWPTYDGKQLDRTEYVTASESSSCARRLTFNKKKGKATVTIPNFWRDMSDEDFQAHLLDMGNDDMRGIFARGNNIEAWLVDQLNETAQEDEFFLCLGDEQMSFYSDKKKVSGTPDGIHVDIVKRQWRTLEFKSTQNPIYAPRSYHVEQVNVNAGLISSIAKTGELDEIFDLPFSEYELAGCNLLYVDACNYLTMQEFRLDYDPDAYIRAGEKAKKVFVKNKAGDIVLREPMDVEPEGLENNGCFFCEFKAECKAIEDIREHGARAAKLASLIDRAKKPEEKMVMPAFASDAQKADVIKAARKYDDARFKETSGKKEKEAVRDALKPWISEVKGRTMRIEDQGEEIKISLTSSDRKGSFDMRMIEDKLKELGWTGDIDTFRAEGTTVETFNLTIKPIKD